MNIFSLNCQAVGLLREGQYNEASALFRAALNQLLSHIVEGKQGLSSQGSHEGIVKFRSVAIRESTGSSSKALHYDAFSLYDRAFLLDEGMVAEGSSLASLEQEDRNITSAILLYNLGLAYHLMGIGGTLSSHDHNLRKALKLYKMMLDVADHCHNDDDCKIFYLAAWNNMGHIYSQFCEEGQVQSCLDWLRSVLAVASDNDETWNEDYFHFTMNILLLHGHSTVVAAAA